jgi:hypothetical protein
MRLATKEEAQALHNLYTVITEIITTVPLDRQTIVSVLLKITASIALAEDWDREELLQAFGYTYDMEKFLNPTSKEKH